jgi:hypothetical protein
MERLEKRGGAIAAAARVRVIERLADGVRGDVPGDVEVTVEPAGVVLSGKRLRARMVTDARLRVVAKGAGR